MKSVRPVSAALNLPTLRLEGGLFLPDLLEKAAQGQARLQTEADYAVPKGLKLKDEYSRSFQIACAQWKSFAPFLERRDVNAQQAVTTFITELLRDALSYPAVNACGDITLGDRHYPVTLLASPAPAAGSAARSIPIVVAPHTLGLDDADPRFAVSGGGSRRKSPFQLAQELLNASPEHQWALVTNGRTLRLLRDAATLTRPSYLELDLQDLLGAQRFAEFATAWRLLHASRAGLLGSVATHPAPLVWEAWREAGQEEGTRVRNGLRRGVTEALITLGRGFVQHPANDALRQALLNGTLSKEAYFAELLRLIYRFIFLFSVEERGLIPNAPQADDDADTARAKHAAAQVYAQGYALARLRELALRRRARTRFDDLWQGVRIVFRGLADGEPRLGLPALGGLFAPAQCPTLDGAQLTNAALLEAMQSLRWTATRGGPLAPIDYRNMGTEELGSVYESLLELVPEVDVHAREFGFVGLTSVGSTAGNDRKLTGSYYTPDSLVQELIKSALDPVIEQRLADNPQQPEQALLALRVIDPACGSGHFLLAAARRLAERLASLRSVDGAVTPQTYRHALREVVARCIFGVDRNPMAIELARTALWLEGFEEGRPLGFLDHHLQVGDALLGLTDLKALELGIAKDAFKPLSGDDKDACKRLAKDNTTALKDLEKKRIAQTFGQLDVTHQNDSGLATLQALEALPEDSPAEIAAKADAYGHYLQEARTGRLAQAANLLLGAYLLPKTADTAHAIPTTATLYLTMLGVALPANQHDALAAAQAACGEARVLHWPLAFPQVFAQGGFDCVLGNPPWEVSQMGEEEFFATRAPHIANLAGDKRKRAIAALPVNDPRLWVTYVAESQRIAAANNFFRESGRYPLTAIGKLNTYPLFAETISQITASKGRAGFIVPTGIATDDSNKAYFSNLTQNGQLVSLYDIENRDAVFPAVHRSYKFCLLTLGDAEQAEFVCFASQVNQLCDPRRRFTLTPNDFRLINPNTLTCPVFRSERDAELTKKIYRSTPVLIEETRPDGNPWGITFSQGLFNMTSDSHLFLNALGHDRLPLYEAKLIHQFDHRWATYTTDGVSRDLNNHEKIDPANTVTPRYWVSKVEVHQRHLSMNWKSQWMIGWRRNCRSTDERTCIANIIPYSGVGDSIFLMLPQETSPALDSALLANMNSLVFDFVSRQKVGGINFSFYFIKQLPTLPPDLYSDRDITFIVPRVLELTYTAHDLATWAQDLGFDGPPFAFNPERRAVLRAELDAYYAKLYGLDRDELRYILDPAEVMGDDYPSETFRVLKNREIKEFGEYRTQRLVLHAFDRLTLAEANGESYVSLLDPAPGQHAQPSHSPRGVIKDEIDTRLAGLLLTMIRQNGNLPRRQVTTAFIIAAHPEWLGNFVSTHNAELVGDFVRNYPGIFAADRTAADRIQKWLRHFESIRVIRIDAQTGGLLANPDASLPNDLLVDDATAQVAAILIEAATAYAAGSTVSEEQTSDTQMKRA